MGFENKMTEKEKKSLAQQVVSMPSLAQPVA
jgi:hypothetical protein